MFFKVGTGCIKPVHEWLSRAIESARLESVAEITGKESSEIISALEEKGIAVEDPTMSVREIARTNHREPMEVLGVVFR
jgi:hypothetical protein